AEVVVTPSVGEGPGGAGGATPVRPGPSLTFGVTALIVLLAAAIAAFVLFRHKAVTPTRSIAVLPFKSLGGKDDAYLGLGMTDVLITRLSNVHGIVVRPTTAVRRFEKPDQDPVAAGRELRVESVLDGTIQHIGDQVRITVRLWNVSDGRTIWADQ